MALTGIGIPAQAAVPTGISISSLTPGNSYVEVAYTGGTGATSFGYQISTDNFALDPDPAVIVVSDSDKVSPFTIGNLINGVRYHIKVVALNADGRTLSNAADTIVGPKTAFVGAGTSRNAFLQGQFAEVGIRANGAFGSNQTAPSGFHPYTSCLGFRVDRSKDGWKATTTDDGDFFCPGTEYEGWFLKVGSNVAHNYDGNASSPQIAGTFSDLNTSGGEQSVRWTATSAWYGISVSQLAIVPDNSQVLHVDVTLTNVSGSEVNGIYYGRAFDPDNNTGTPDVYRTDNTVVSSQSPAVVQSAWGNGAQISIRSSDPGARAAKRTGGLSGSDPQHIWDAPESASGANSWTANGSTTYADAGTGVAVSVSSLAVGASTTFRVSYVLSDDEANIPTSPSITSIVPGDGTLTVNFNQSYNSPENYEYSLDDGVSWISRSPESTQSPLLLTGLTNGTSYPIKLRGFNNFGTSPPSVAVTGVPATLPQAPRLDYVLAGAGSVNVGFTPGSNGGSPITNYQYAISTDGVNFSDFASYSPEVTQSPLAISGLTPGVDYWVKVKAINAIGLSSESDVIQASAAAAPDAPTVSSITATDEALSIGFDFGGDGGLTIDTLEWSLDGGGTWDSASPSVLSSPLELSGLTNGTTYTVQLRARNAVGYSLGSNSTDATPRGVPDAPSYSGSVAASGNQISLTIIPASDNGSAITNYQYSTDRGSTWRVRTDSGGSATGLVIDVESSDGTTPLSNQVYCVQIRAVNDAGVGAASDDACFEAKTAPDTPTISSIVDGNGKATIQFDPGSNGGSAITGVEYSTDGTTWISASALTSPITVVGLTNGTTYNFQIRTQNIYGNSGSSNEISAVPSTTPGVPVIERVIPSSTKLTIEFAEGSNGGLEITNYQYSLDGGSNWIGLSPSSTLSPMVISGLTNDTTYQVQIRAINANGPGISTGTELASTPRLIPEAPSITAISAGNSQLSVGYVAGEDNGSPLTNYEFSLDDGITWQTRAPSETSSPILIQGLANSTSYSVRLRALSAFGIGAASAVVTGTPFGVPLAPTITSVTAVTANALDVAFDLGGTGGRPITNYEYSSNAGTTWTPLSPAATSSTLVVRGLTKSTAYFVKIRAVNEAGSGVPSNTFEATTNNSDETTPPELASVVLLANGRQLQLSYDEPLSNTTATSLSFTVLVDGLPVSISAVSATSNTVLITLVDLVTAQGVATLSYADPTGSNDSIAIQDALGNDAISFSNEPVTNNSTASAAGLDSVDISGEIYVGEYLTAVLTGLVGSAPVSVVRNWQIFDTATSAFSSSAETGSSLLLTNDFLGKKLRLAATVSNALGSETQYSSQTGTVSARIQEANIVGTATPGNTLSVVTSGLAPNSSVTYRWQIGDESGNNFADLSSTASSLAVSTSQIASTVRVIVSAGRNSVTSSATSSSVLILDPSAQGSPASGGLVGGSAQGVKNLPIFTNPIPVNVGISTQSVRLVGANFAGIEKIMLLDGTVLRVLYQSDNQLLLEIPTLGVGKYSLVFTSSVFGKYTYMDMVSVGGEDLLPLRRVVKYFPLDDLKYLSQNISSGVAAWTLTYPMHRFVACVAYVRKGASTVERARASALASRTCAKIPTTGKQFRTLVYTVRTDKWNLNQALIVIDP